MRKSLTKRFFLLASILFLSILIVSCNSTKKIKYFQDIPDSGQTKTFKKVDFTPLTIHTGDILSINIGVIDNTATSAINAANLVTPGATASTSSLPASGGAASLLASLSGGNSSSQSPGYTVLADSTVDMPMLGKIKAAGYSIDELRERIHAEATKYFKDPVVDVKFANFKVNITGEVQKPGQYIMPDEKETIFDALAMAGDLTIFAKRENVLLLRQNEDGTRTAYRINLKKSDILTSPLYYMRQNDLIYVEPRKAKSDATDASQAKWFGIVGAVMSVLIITATRIK